MSVWVSMTIVCNGCRAEHPVPLGANTRHARTALGDEGWACIGGREDYCPACSTARRVTTLRLVAAP